MFFDRLVKTLAKPVANRIKIEVRKHPKFSELCSKIGQLSHQITSRLNVYASGYKVLTIDPLPNEDALQRGINFVSETFIFSVGAGILVFEYARSEAKSAAKQLKAEQDEAEFRMYLDNKFVNVYDEIKSLHHEIDQLQRRIESMEQIQHESVAKRVIRKVLQPTTTTTPPSSSSSSSTSGHNHHTRSIQDVISEDVSLSTTSANSDNNSDNDNSTNNNNNNNSTNNDTPSTTTPSTTAVVPPGSWLTPWTWKWW